jgi:hypothetical protein
MAATPRSSAPVTQGVSNIVSGRIIQKETGSGIANLQVDLFDLDNWPDPELKEDGVVERSASSAASATDVGTLYRTADRIGSVITDESGQIAFEIVPKDFNLPGKKAETKPDLVLVVLAPDEPGLELNARVLFIAKDLRLNAGSREGYIIRLPSALLAKHEIPLTAQREPTTAAAQDDVKSYIARKSSAQTFNTGVAEYHAEISTREIADRKVFRKDFLTQVATDFGKVPTNGVLVADGDNIQEKNNQVIAQGIIDANNVLGGSSSDGIPVNLYLTEDDRTRLQTYFDNASGGYAEVPDSEMGDILFRSNSSENPGTLLVNNNPIAAFCGAQNADIKCAKEHAGLPVLGDGEMDAPTTTPTPAPGGDGSISKTDVPLFVGRLLNDMPSPDVVLHPELANKRADRATVEKSVSDFSLQRGPAEVPAFYDFNVLQIAFDHVWKQLFDESIPDLAYTANPLGQQRFGVSNIVSLFNNGLRLSGTYFAISPVEVSPVVARFFDITKEEYNDMSVAFRESLDSIANAIAAKTNPAPVTVGFGGILGTVTVNQGMTVQRMREIQALSEQGERLIDSVRHDDYYTLHRTLRELHDRMNGKYNFTVFAADKDYHSVNFGLWITYREKLTPSEYQAGKLLKTIPLAPKEEKKYSVKLTRNEKRSRKEARKNNSTISNEQASTSRVEADIMAKAQTKTTFSANAEGDYDIGISSGKGTTSFGVEAIGESAQNRKDIREAVLKAAQVYNDEVSKEIVTETDVGSEYVESGTLLNPNEELSVTYLFYELQKRYLLSEQLYRVMPVVLVAQEMPSPDQITEAWVIANDWIINRSLLDDSFRPTLAYLANRSVGDDFALRELRKNLRQQRNLVNTLQIEFSAASMEADNRYKALETAISGRIDEEHREATDGFGSDFLDFFGGGGQDPQAAKARELAAKDAHQYALEKAEKAAAALRQEVNTLHVITDNYNKTLQERLDNETKVKRLLVHLVNNITHYMHAIWNMEPPDQRYLRLYKVQVPVLELASRSYRVNTDIEDDIFEPFRTPGTEKHKAFLHGTLKHNTDGSFDTVPLVQVANLDKIVACVGNYLVFEMIAHNALTQFMSAPYIDSAFGAMDPDELANVNLDQYSKYVCCLHDKLPPDDFEAIKPQLKAWLEKLMATPLRNNEEIVVPTGSLFIEALVDKNPILEDFKLKHRELDVFEVNEKVRRAGLENIRLAARLLNEERGDPDVDKKILVEGVALSPGFDVDNP